MMLVSEVFIACDFVGSGQGAQTRCSFREPDIGRVLVTSQISRQEAS